MLICTGQTNTVFLTFPYLEEKNGSYGVPRMYENMQRKLAKCTIQKENLAMGI
jgi:hypothetical protein